MLVKPISGHRSFETAYIIPDYPYSFSLRCRKACWIDAGKKGFRLITQTTNPKKNDIWNAAKKGTYHLLAGSMYLDEDGHLQFEGLNEYSSSKTFVDFLTRFPNAEYSKDIILAYCLGKMRLAQLTIQGEAVISINKVPQLPSEADREKAKVDLKNWTDCVYILRSF